MAAPSSLAAALLILATAPPAAPAAPAATAEAAPDLAGRSALLRSIDSALAAGRFNAAEQLLRDFRRRYPASSGVRSWDNGNEVAYLFEAVYALGQHHAAAGDLAKVLALYDEELRGLTAAVPHHSWRLLAQKAPLLLAADPEADLAAHRAELVAHQALFTRRAGEVEHPGRQDLFRGLATRMESAVRHLDLIGKPAPALTFSAAFNASPSLSLAELRGRVVLIDFWATWCPPCMAAWPSLAELYRQHRGRGLEILSVTSLQGSYGAEKGISRERELELTEQVVRRHQVSWPVLFSTRPANDPAYAATTLPLYAIVDRDGTLHRILVGDFGAIGKEVLSRLLAATQPASDASRPRTPGR